MKEKRNIILLVISIIFVLIAVYYVYDVYKDTTKESSEIINNTNIAENYNDFTIYDKEENEIKLSNFEGTPRLILFWKTSVNDSVEMLKIINSYYEEYKDKVTILVVSESDGVTESIKSVEKYLELKEISMPVYYDLNSDASLVYNITELPTMISIDENNNIINTKTGVISEDALEANLDLLLNNI